MNTSIRLALAAASMAAGAGAGLALLAHGCGASATDLANLPLAGACMRAAPQSAYYAGMSCLLGLVGAVVASGVANATGKDKARFAEKVWSDEKDAAKAGLLIRKGDDVSRIRIVGKVPRKFGTRGRLMSYCGDAHMLVAGANRSGKGRGILVPTLLSYGQSVIAVDSKGEFLWGDERVGFDGTSGWRSTFSRIVYFCPTDRRSARFNFLKACRGGEYEVRDVQNLILAVLKATKPTFWDKTAQELCVGIGLHLRNVGGGADVSIAGIRKYLARGDDAVREMVVARAHEVAVRIGMQLFPAGLYGDEGDKMVAQRSDTYRTAQSYLWLFDDPTVAAVTSGDCDFMPGDLMCGDEPMSLYIRNAPSDAERTSKLIHLMLSQIWRDNMEFLNTDSRGRRKRWRCCAVMDEFDGLGHMEDFETLLPQMAGYGFECLISVQTLGQIYKKYGENNSIIDNCHVLVTFSANDSGTLRRIESMIGAAEEIRESRSTSLGRGGRSVSTSENRQVRKIMDSGQIRTLPETDEFIFRIGYRPWIAKKVLYDKEVDFQDRLLPPVIEAPSARANVLEAEHV